jgi:hypothetical protein
LLWFGYGRTAVPPLVMSIIFVLLGTILFGPNRMQPTEKAQALSVMEAAADQLRERRWSAHVTEEREGKLLLFVYHRLWYSLDVFLPGFIKLEVREQWLPKSQRLRTYVFWHQAAGYVLTAFIALAVATFVK